MKADGWPTHAYVPGKTARHPEHAFEAIRETARAGLTPAQLSECAAFRMGMRYIHAGYFWEAHELLEPVWMALPNPSAERDYVQALIQIANGLLKLKMDKPKAAVRLEKISRKLLQNSRASLTESWRVDEATILLETLRDKMGTAL